MIRAVALPRIRSKRRRRKPIPPWLKVYLGLVILGCGSVFYWAVKVLLGDSGARFWLALGAACLVINWSVMAHFWRNWRDGE